ncbi:MAG TPA: Xaa-Pro dipeptidase [Polyangiales bacterium]|nr:Xaa-Pro dipeptidase [Polyangiales bacterium]
MKQTYAQHLSQLEHSYGQVLAASGYDAVVIHSGSAKKRSEFDDQYWPLRPTPHFQHWLPLSAADCALIAFQGKKPKLIWTRQHSFWETTEQPSHDFWHSGFEITVVGDRAAVKAHLPTGHIAFIGEDHKCGITWGFGETAINPPELLKALDGLRTRKTRYEELCLEEANRLASLGHNALANAFQSGDASELELHLLYLRATQQDDPETPYKNIVALGPNAATLHHVTYQRSQPKAADAQSLLVDAGASFLGYCSDITRTHVKGSGATASAFTGLVAGLEHLQQKLCAEVRVGSKYEALHDRSHQYVAQTLREVGIVKGSEDEAVSSGVTRAFFPHGLGHSLGLQCHDVGCALSNPRPDNPFLRNTSEIAARQCFTIEPGIYFIQSLLEPVRQGKHSSQVDWQLVTQLAALGGARIEDDLVVGEAPEGTRNLTRAYLPNSLS